MISLAAGAGFASSTNELPKFDEVYQLLRANLNGVSDADLNRAAVQGLLAQFQSSAMLVGSPAADTSPAADPLGKTAIYDDSYAYFRVLKVETNLATELATTYHDFAKTNKAKIKGVVLDLRFAGGSDFPPAAAAANSFLNSDQPLLECGGATLRSTKKDDAITVPLAVLINSKTSEAAEGLAAILRLTSTGLLLGSQTAGHAGLFKDFPLGDGGKLRIAAGEVKMGDGTVFNGAVKPDITVNISLEEDRVYWEHPYQQPASGATTNLISGKVTTNAVPTNGAFRHFNEAELVREQRDGVDLEADFAGRGSAQPDADVKILRDPALSRALDLLKGLAVVQQGHPG